MTKAEIVAKVAEEIKVSKAAAAKALAVITGSIAQAIRKGGKVALIGFGTFSVAERKARKGRNPQTGKEIKIAAKKVPKFSAGAGLKGSSLRQGSPCEAESKKSSGETEKEIDQDTRRAFRPASFCQSLAKRVESCFLKFAPCRLRSSAVF